MLNAGVRGLPRDTSAEVPTVPSAATQAEMEAASSTSAYATPGTVKYSPGVAKAWAHVTISGGTPTLAAGHNFSGTITDHGAGDFTLTFTTALSSAFFASFVVVERSGSAAFARVDSQSTTAIRVKLTDASDTLIDTTAFSLVVFGDFT